MNTKDLLDNSTVKSLLTAMRRYTFAIGSRVDLKGIGRRVLVILDAGSFAATGTLTVLIEESADGTTNWTTLHTFATLDVVASVVADMAPSKRYIRANATAVDNTIDFGVEGIIYLERERPSTL